MSVNSFETYKRAHASNPFEEQPRETANHPVNSANRRGVAKDSCVGTSNYRILGCTRDFKGTPLNRRFTLLKSQIRRCLFLSLGLTRVYEPSGRYRRGVCYETLLEPDRARICRRNLLALGGVLVVTGLSGANLSELNVFGITPHDDWGITVIGAAVIVVQFYWYILRYLHFKEDGILEQEPVSHGESRLLLKIKLNNSFSFAHKSANLVANWIAFILTIASWYFVGSWIVNA